MGLYSVIIEEIATKQFVVEAEDVQKAAFITRDKYRSGEFVLDPGEIQGARLAVLDVEGQICRWEEL